MEDLILSAIGTHVKIGATYHLPYQMMASAPANASVATAALSRNLGISTNLVTMIPTLKITKGLLKELKF